jgi:hypothetical protein
MHVATEKINNGKGDALYRANRRLEHNEEASGQSVPNLSFGTPIHASKHYG